MRTGFAFLNTIIYPLCKRNDSGDENMTKQTKKAPGGVNRRGKGGLVHDLMAGTSKPLLRISFATASRIMSAGVSMG